eukprot:IDg8756t1
MDEEEYLVVHATATTGSRRRRNSYLMTKTLRRVNKSVVQNCRKARLQGWQSN